MTNALGELVASELARAESDVDTFRNRGQTVLSLSGGLVALVGAVLAIASSGSNTAITEAGRVCAALGLMSLLLAAVLVSLMFRPLSDNAPNVADLRERVETDWDNPRWDETVALLHLKHLERLRWMNNHLANLLLGAIVSQTIGVLFVIFLAMTILDSL